MKELEPQLKEAKYKKDWTRLASDILKNNKLEDLILLFLNSDNKRVSQQAAGVFMELVNLDKNIFYEYQDKLVQYLLQEDAKEAQVRNIFRLFQFAFIREEIEGALLDASFKVLENPTQPIAVRVFAMTVAYRIGERYPEVFPELKNLIETNLELANSSGFQNRALKLLQKMKEME